jgi:hypothetical protein
MMVSYWVKALNNGLDMGEKVTIGIMVAVVVFIEGFLLYSINNAPSLLSLPEHIEGKFTLEQYNSNQRYFATIHMIISVMIGFVVGGMSAANIKGIAEGKDLVEMTIGAYEKAKPKPVTSPPPSGGGSSGGGITSLAGPARTWTASRTRH